MRERGGGASERGRKREREFKTMRNSCICVYFSCTNVNAQVVSCVESQRESNPNHRKIYIDGAERIKARYVRMYVGCVCVCVCWLRCVITWMTKACGDPRSRHRSFRQNQTVERTSRGIYSNDQTGAEVSGWVEYTLCGAGAATGGSGGGRPWL